MEFKMHDGVRGPFFVSASASVQAPEAAQAVSKAVTAPPGAWLGVLGGGQLGRMLVHAAQRQGYRVLVLEPDAASPAAAAADDHLLAAYDDAAALQEMARRCAAVTTEFENVPAQVLRRLAECGVPVAPAAAAVEVCQHRVREKQTFEAAGVPCAPYAAFEGAHTGAQQDVASLLPGILKTATLGYDGKGQHTVRDWAELQTARAHLGAAPCVLEKRLALQREISVVVARARDGSCVHLPVQQNLHIGGVLACTQVPAADVSEDLQRQAIGSALHLATGMNYVGVLCVEFFVLADGTLVANEMAPRPHNSGHYSIDACDCSQFDLQLRCMTGLPLVQPRQHSAAVMLNLMGDLWWPAGQEGAKQATEPDWATVCAMPGVHLHLYGKTEARRGRKMGHLTVTAVTSKQARATAERVAAALGLGDSLGDRLGDVFASP